MGYPATRCLRLLYGGLQHRSGVSPFAFLFVIPTGATFLAAQRRDEREAICPGNGGLKNYWLYIMSGRTKTLYIGVTNDIERRNYEQVLAGFSSKYRLDLWVYFEEYSDIQCRYRSERSKSKPGGQKKVALIESLNSKWRDLSLDWHADERSHDTNKSLRVDPSSPPLRSARSG